jgi:hypothetical protein
VTPGRRLELVLACAEDVQKELAKLTFHLHQLQRELGAFTPATSADAEIVLEPTGPSPGSAPGPSSPGVPKASGAATTNPPGP